MKPTNPTPEAIKQARAHAGLTQTQAGLLIYTPLRTWQDWEAGKRPMHPAMFELFKLKTQAGTTRALPPPTT